MTILSNGNADLEVTIMESAKLGRFLRAAAIIVACQVLGGCQSDLPRAMTPSDTPPQATGEVRPLRSMLARPGESLPSTVKLVLVHGMGDHCPGYALDFGAYTGKGWLSQSNRQVIGLVADASPPDLRYYILPSIKGLPLHVSQQPNVPWFAIAQQGYTLRMESGVNIRIEATEITWSGLTQSIKSAYLGYDTTNEVVAPAVPTRCATTLARAAGSPPGTREALNKLIKEELFNAAVADAVLYMGPYRSTMQLAVAYGLCQAIGTTRSGCDWPDNVDSLPTATRYLFVTHSLGSRILYDALLGLSGEGQASALFEMSAIRRPPPSVMDALLGATPAIYMMANQLPLLGLANMPDDLQLGAEPIALAKEPEAPGSDPLRRDDTCEVASGCRAVPDNQGLKALLDSPMVARLPHPLNIYAFSDINDVLSWSLPARYGRVPGENPPAGSRNVAITNIFVRNEPWFPALLEMPWTAHTDYFVNGTVWRVISRGLCGSTLGSCQEPGRDR